MNSSLSWLTDAELLQSTRRLLERSHQLDAELLLLLGEIDARRLYAERAFPSMFAFCTAELCFSEDVACNRIGVARLARRFPRVLDFIRSGQILRPAPPRGGTRGRNSPSCAARCSTHNQLCADKLYGSDFMQDKRRGVRPGADSQALLL